MEAGPEIPPHILEKRKRKAEEAAKAAKNEVTSNSEEASEKRARIIGPAPPPAPLDERPTHGPEDESSSDDEIGPSLPTGPVEEEELAARERLARYEDSQRASEANKKPKRDEWMLAPPKQEDWTSRVDPTKIRNRKFQTGKGSRAPQKSGGDSTLWTETPQEKLKRLEDEVMGVRRPATQADARSSSKKNTAEAEETARRIREYNEKHRTSSLYTDHQKTTTKKDEDDPSKRKWDREKDLAAGTKISRSQKNEMLQRAAQFGDRFSSGSFL